MIVELHMLQNFAPSNLNRDDTGSPKDCEFGGYRRGRISSQCQKRAIRLAFKTDGLLPAENLGYRTKRLVEAIARRLTLRDSTMAARVAEAALGSIGLSSKDGETEYLVFLGTDEIDSLAQACEQHWDALVAAGSDVKVSKKEAKAAIPKEVAASFLVALDGRRAADLALFGRMLADLPSNNRDAACQLAHALSTNRVSAEFDFFTTVDDLKPASDDAGAGMLGTVEFNSSCYYRYANIDFQQLSDNLGGDEELARATVEAFIHGFVSAMPSGKQNSFAAHNPPSLIFVVVRDRGMWSLANAFVKPVTPRGEVDLIGGSISALAEYWGRLVGMYGDGAIRDNVVCVDPLYAGRLASLGTGVVPSVGAMVARVMSVLESPTA